MICILGTQTFFIRQHTFSPHVEYLGLLFFFSKFGLTECVSYCHRTSRLPSLSLRQPLFLSPVVPLHSAKFDKKNLYVFSTFFLNFLQNRTLFTFSLCILNLHYFLFVRMPLVVKLCKPEPFP
jgi:hypothetical protein